MAIRYDSSYNKEIQRVVRNYNAKIARLRASGQRILPENASIRDLKRNFINRRQLNKELGKLQAFSARGAERIIENASGVAMTEYQWAIARAENRATKGSITRELKKLPATSKGNAIALNERRLTLQNVRDALDIDWENATSVQIAKAVHLANIQIHSPAKKSSFKTSILKIMGQTMLQVGMDEKTVAETLKYLRSRTPEELESAYYSNEFISTLFDHYSFFKDGTLNVDDFREVSKELVERFKKGEYKV